MDLQFAKDVLRAESKAIASLVDRLGDGFSRASRMVHDCKGHVVVTGMGKAGLIGQKISATLASTGTPSHFLHPAEAYHGDLGRVTKNDVLLALSNSGETEELIRLLPRIKEMGASIISITAGAGSSLGRHSDAVVEIGMIEEAAPGTLAPSASTAAMLAIGDALALLVQKERGFDQEQYAFYHPGGDLGRKLSKVRDVMRSGERNPIVAEATTVLDALKRITSARAGAIIIAAKDGTLAGIFTDGDLRRLLERDPKAIQGPIAAVMTKSPTTIGPDKLVAEALGILRGKRIDELPVVNEKREPVGMLDIQDVLGLGTP